MSVFLMGHVWKVADLSSSEKIVLLAMTDRAEDDGGSLYPSIRYISIKVGLSERQVQRILNLLIKEGYISVIGNHYGGKVGNTRQYQINVKFLMDKVGDKLSGGNDDHTTSTPSKGDTHVTQSISNPLGIEKNITKKENVIDMPEWMPKEAWANFYTHRREIKKPVTAASMVLIIKKLDMLRKQGNPPADVLNQSIERGWQGIFPLAKDYVSSTGQQDNPNSPTPPPHVPMTAERLRMIEQEKAMGC